MNIDLQDFHSSQELEHQKKSLVFNKLSLQNFDIFINGHALLTIAHLEWNSDIIESNTMRDGKLLSSAFQIQPVRGHLLLEQSEKIALAEALQIKNRLLTGYVCDLVASTTHEDDDSSEAIHFTLRSLRFGSDSFIFSSKLDSLVKVNFLILGSIDWNRGL